MPDKSERRFKARLAVLDEQRRNAIQDAFSGAVLPDERHLVLEDYLRISIDRRSDPYPLLKLQLHLLFDLVTVEKVIAAGKRRLGELDAHPDPTRSAEDVAHEKDAIERQLFLESAERRALRDIADGIAWRVFDYDRAVLHELANRPSAHHVELGGLTAELTEFMRTYDSREGIALLNDLTHFLKIGDVTVRRDDGTFEIIEVKAGSKKSGRIQRQKRDTNRLLTLLNLREGESHEGTVVLSEVPVQPESLLSALDRVATAAARTGTAWEKVGDHLIVICVDFPKAMGLGLAASKTAWDHGFSLVERWQAAGDFIVPCDSLEKYEFVRNYAPYSIYHLPLRIRVRLMTGALWCISFVNLSAVLRYFQGRGWVLVKSPEEHLEEAERTGNTRNARLITLRKGPLTTELPAPLVGRLGYEFLKPRTLVEMSEAVLARGPAASGLELTTLSGEPDLWE